MTRELDTFQHEALRFMNRAQGRMVLADPMGARKTGTTAAWLESNEAVGRVLIVAPASVHGHWAHELGEFAPTFQVAYATGKTKRADALMMAANHWPSAYITTYESMKKDQHVLDMTGFDTVVFDEGHRLKGRTTQVALAANVFAKAERCIIVTDTPVLNHASELWQYLHMLAPKVYRSFWRWAEEHFIIEVKNFQRNRFPTRIIHGFRAGHEDIVRTQIAPFFLQRDIEDLFPSSAWIAEAEHVEYPVELSTAERKVYDNLVKHKWALVGGNELTTSNGLDLTTRLTQLTADWGTVGGEELGTKINATIELTMDLLERDEPVLIGCKYIGTVERIVETLRAKHVTALAYHGGIDPWDRDVAVAQFGNGKCSVLIGTLDSMSEGVDGLQQRCNNAVMLDRHWVAAKNDQFIGRLRRSGQVRRVNVHHIFAEDTIDATITAACLRKTNVVQTLRDKPLVDIIYGRV